MAKILLVEDDLDIASILQLWFARENDTLEIVGSAEDALHMLTAFDFDVILLDWNLPGMSGFEMCRRYRDGGGTTAIIFLSGRNDVTSKTAALDNGADDFLAKPFDPRELSSRIRSVLRRPTTVQPTALAFEDLVLDTKRRTVTAGGRTIEVMPKQCAVLEFLIRRPHQPFRSEQILNGVWSSDSNGSTESVRTCVKTLRKQLALIGKSDFVKTDSRQGYFIGSAAG